MAVPVTPAAASSGGIQAECNKIGQRHLYRQMGLIRYAQQALRKPVCAGTSGAGSIAEIVNREGARPDYENRRKTSSGGQRI